MEEEIKRKVFLEGLPNRRNESNKGNINWKESIGYKVPFQYSGIIGEVEIVNCNTKDEELTIKYENKEVKIRISNFKKCRLGKLLNKRTSEFKIEIGTKFKDIKRDIVITDREYRQRKDKKGSSKWYKYACSICGWTEGWMIESKVKSGQGCSCCGGSILVEGINDIPTIAPWMVKYFQGGYDEAKLYTKSCGKKIYLTCPDCGRVLDKRVYIANLYKNKTIGCSCSDNKSYVCKFVFNILEQLKESNQIQDFYTEVKCDWCNFYNPFKKRESFGIYDFVIENLKLIIETDGEFHRKNNNMSGQSKIESEWLDNIKDELAKEHGYNIVRISDEGDVKQNIVNSKLNLLFNLNDINWIKCGEYACSNLIKEVCEYWKLHNEINNEELTTSNIGKLFKLDRNTVTRYLKSGSDLNWCYYNVEEEMVKGRKKTSFGKRVSIFTLDGILLGTFQSCSELSRKSEGLFGVNLNAGKISLVCIGKRNKHKGYTFKYVDDLTEEEYIKYDIENKLKELKNAS